MSLSDSQRFQKADADLLEARVEREKAETKRIEAEISILKEKLRQEEKQTKNMSG